MKISVIAVGRIRDPFSDAEAHYLKMLRGRQDISMLIGGPNGLNAEARARLDDTVSLGKQTLAHQLARINLLEQLFRSSKILAGEPYHL